MSNQRLLGEIQWLTDNPHFEERPATIREFIGAEYLGLQDTIRPGVMAALIEIFGEDVDPNWISLKRRAVATGGIGWGKSTLASIILTYCVHWCYCLKDPQGFFKLMPGSRIAFMLMSTSESQAKEVLFADIKARIEASPWFQQFCDYDRNFKNQLRMAKDLWIVPGGSEESRFEGYNVLCKDEKTEILTTSGWKKYNEISVGEQVLTLNHETGLSEWKPLQRVNVFDSPGELVRMEGSEFSSLSTDGHNWATIHRDRVSGGWKRRWKTTATLNHEDRIPVSAISADRPIVPVHSDALVEAVAWYYTEGCIVGKSGVMIYQKTGSVNADRIRVSLTKILGPPSKELQSTNSTVDQAPRWRENPKSDKPLTEFRLNRYAGPMLMEHAPDKVPSHEFLLSLTQSQLEMFLDISMKADNRGPELFSQKHHPAAEAYAFAAILAGKPVSIKPQWQPVGEDGYEMLNVRTMKKHSIGPVASSKSKSGRFVIERVPHEGIVWCPTVDNSTWLARREGSVYFTGNCGVIDEGDSHKQTKRKDYAEEGYDTISSRISSRFTDPVSNKYRGLLVVIGQMKSKVGFMSKIYAEFKDDPDAAAIRMPYWLSFGWHHYTEDPKDIEGGRETAPRKSFVYDIQHKRILSRADAEEAGVDFHTRDSGYLEVPTAFLTQFKRNPVKALRDLAGIPPEASDPFIALPHRISLCQQAWEQRMGEGAPVTDSATYPAFTSSFRPTNRIRRVAHVDIAYSGENGDAMGIAMAHIPGIISVDGEDKPLIVFDFLMRIKAKPGSQIELSEMRRILRQVRDDHGYNLSMITFDGFASVDSMQLLRKASFQVDYISVDRNKQPYEDLREGIYDERILFPKYMTHMNPDDSDTVNVAYQELSQLTDVGPKIDHPPSGSKDVADAMASCVSVLMQMPQWRRGAPLLETRSSDYAASDVESEDLSSLGEMFTKARKPQPVPGEVPSLSEFTSGRLGESSPGVTRVKERTSAPFVGSSRSGPVPGNPFLR